MRAVPASDSLALLRDARTGIVYGWVRDDSTGAGVEGAEVRVLGRTPQASSRAITGADGQFILTLPAVGSASRFVVEARQLAYVTRRDTLALPLPPSEVLDVRLRPRLSRLLCVGTRDRAGAKAAG
jgi:hypothetical protein